jgi:DNA-binding NarL/FixJ family response regulator
MTSEQKSAASLTVTVVDDHEAIHAAVRTWCQEAQPPIFVSRPYFSSHDFLASQRDDPQPGVVIFDLEKADHRPDFDGLKEVVNAGHRVIVYSYLSSDELVLRCLEIGAVTYLVKSEGRAHMLEAIRAARSAEPYVGPRMAGAMINDQSVGRPNLAPREKQILIAWFQTESKELVARKLALSESTVRTLLQRVRAKYASVGRQAPTKAALVARALQDGIISIDDL